jgi:hypothetical protein
LPFNIAASFNIFSTRLRSLSPLPPLNPPLTLYNASVRANTSTADITDISITDTGTRTPASTICATCLASSRAPPNICTRRHVATPLATALEALGLVGKHMSFAVTTCPVTLSSRLRGLRVRPQPLTVPAPLSVAVCLRIPGSRFRVSGTAFTYEHART